jgi:hypothetical protein
MLGDQLFDAGDMAEHLFRWDVAQFLADGFAHGIALVNRHHLEAPLLIGQGAQPLPLASG